MKDKIYNLSEYFDDDVSKSTFNKFVDNARTNKYCLKNAETTFIDWFESDYISIVFSTDSKAESIRIACEKTDYYGCLSFYSFQRTLWSLSFYTELTFEMISSRLMKICHNEIVLCVVFDKAEEFKEITT